MSTTQTNPYNLVAYDYSLPKELIASEPVTPRDHSRLLVYRRRSQTIEHHKFYELPKILRTGDVLVVNDSKVLPARLEGTRVYPLGQEPRARQGPGRIEVLLVEERDPARFEWDAIMDSRARQVPGFQFQIPHRDRPDLPALQGEILTAPNAEGVLRIRFHSDPLAPGYGTLPLPHYMGRKTHPSDETRYQTAYAERLGSVAAPTAGLHFTPELLKVLHEARMGPVAVTLHVGIGTFRPVKTQDIRDHEMHEERYELREEVAAKLQSRRKEGGRVIAVGTTTIRTLESAWNQGELRPGRGRTKLFLYPKEDGSPQGLQSCDGMITNFHLPKSTLLMLVASVIGRSEVLRVYEEAIREKYRFYSYGDAMLLLPD